MKELTVNISFNNLTELIELLFKLKNQAEELQETISQLDNFNLGFRVN